MFFISKYEQNELSYMKIRPQIKKLAFSPSPEGAAIFGGSKNGLLVGGKMEPQFFGLMDP